MGKYVCFASITIVVLLMFTTTMPVRAQQVNVSQNAFPAAVQFSPVPSGKGWRSENDSLTEELQKETISNMIEHGFSVLSVGNWTPKEQTEGSRFLMQYAQSRGMKINYITAGFELFNREHAPLISVYSPRYAVAVKQKVEERLAPLRKIDNVYSLFPYQDEPFHAGPASFDYSKEAKDEFRKRYGYDMPAHPDSVRRDPKKWLDLLNFQSGTFPDGWRQVYKILKAYDPRPKIILTHDSHSAFGGGVNSDSKLAMDDVFHWGGDFADVFIYDIYPYGMFDYRYGELGKLPKPRISQMHYTIAQLRNLTTAYGKELAFWVGTYNKAWFSRFMGPERKKQYWAEQELASTAVAQGANFLITGIKIPSDSLHWENFGEGMKLIQRAGPGLLKAAKVKAKACFLFPRTQYLQLQEEYFNAGLSFELFLRSFGELDILHEDQITDDKLNGYQVLVLADVKLLPAKTAKHIEDFVRSGGIVVADCVPQMDEYMRPMKGMSELFGVNKSETERVIQQGQWVPFTTLPPKMGHAPEGGWKAPEIRSDEAAGTAFGHAYRFKVVSPRISELKKGEPLLNLASGSPALIRNKTGKGTTYLLGFCLQDTYFRTWKDSNTVARKQLYDLLHRVFQDAKLQAHIYSSNPDIEASVRAASDEGYVFVINHESRDPGTEVQLSDLAFRPHRILDIASGRPVEFMRRGNGIVFTIEAPVGTTRLLKLIR